MTSSPDPQTQQTLAPYDVLVVGAGFAGMYALIDARSRGLRAICVESAPQVGGVWQWNRYPGARCDIESLDYSYSFDEELQQEWTWSERYATQPEILRYAEHVVNRYRLRDGIRLNQRVAKAVFDAESATWQVEIDGGEDVRAKHLVLATGSLSTPVRPNIPGLDDFAGQVVMTAAWPHEGVDVTGLKVGVIGTGSSGIQSIPILARSAQHLTVFQRSANYSVPVKNRELTPEQMAEARRDYPRRRGIARTSMAGTTAQAHPSSFWDLDEAERQAAFEARWAEGGVLFGKVFDGQTVDRGINDAAREFAIAKIRSLVTDPAIAESLVPDHAIGTKRICTDTGYFETFNRPNVSLVDLRKDPIVEIRPDGIVTRDGFHRLDVLVLATGFDALTGAVAAIHLEGPGGVVASDVWANGPLTNLGMAIPGLPNLHLIMGPQSPGVFSNAFIAIEQQVDWVMDLIVHCREGGHDTVETTREAAQAWTDKVQEIAAGTLFTETESWYLGANIEGKPRVFMLYAGGLHPYTLECNAVSDAGYAGFRLRAAAEKGLTHA